MANSFVGASESSAAPEPPLNREDVIKIIDEVMDTRLGDRSVGASERPASPEPLSRENVTEIVVEAMDTQFRYYHESVRENTRDLLDARLQHPEEPNESIAKLVAQNRQEIVGLREEIVNLREELEAEQKRTSERFEEHQRQMEGRFAEANTRMNNFETRVQRHTQDIALKSSQESFQALETRQNEAAQTTTAEVNRCSTTLSGFIQQYNLLAQNYHDFQYVFLLQVETATCPSEIKPRLERLIESYWYAENLRGYPFRTRAIPNISRFFDSFGPDVTETSPYTYSS